MNTSESPLIISLKPNYADLVFQGLKTAELRRRITQNVINRDVFIYVSSPVMMLRGGFRVGQVWQGSPHQIWKTVSQMAAVTRTTFDEYYEGTDVAYALEIIDVWEYAHPKSLNQLRDRLGKFVVPQSYRYAKPDELKFFRSLKHLNFPLSNAI